MLPGGCRSCCLAGADRFAWCVQIVLRGGCICFASAVCRSLALLPCFLRIKHSPIRWRAPEGRAALHPLSCRAQRPDRSRVAFWPVIFFFLTPTRNTRRSPHDRPCRPRANLRVAVEGYKFGVDLGLGRRARVKLTRLR